MSRPVAARRRRAGCLGLSALGGAAVMNGEIAASRLLAPHLGTSTTTWAVLIGTVLGSLAAGSLLGGWLSGRPGPERWVARLLGGAGALLGLVPRAVPWLLEASLARLRAGGLAGLGLTAGVSVALVALPMVLLGALPPLLVQAARPAPDDEEPGALGRLSGQLSAAGTLGSLVGTFGAALVLLPALGTRATFDLAAAVLLLTALLAARATGARRAAALSAALLALLALLARRPASWQPSRPGERVVWTGESRHNHIRVVERGGERQLRLNDGFAVQSFARLDGQPGLRDVWAYYALAPAWGTAPAPGRVLLLGLGGGTSARVYRRLYPASEVVGVELDGAVVEAGQRFLGLSPPDARVVIADARPFVEADAGSYDVIVLDAFQFPYVPFQLATREFFAAVRRRLAPGGVVVVNAGRYGDERAVVHALARTLGAVFAHVQSADPPGNRSNTILVATDHEPAAARGPAGLAVGDATAATLRDLALRLAPPRPASWPPGTPLLTDDHAPVEWLTDRIVWTSL